MSHSKFGWDYPPGVTSQDIEGACGDDLDGWIMYWREFRESELCIYAWGDPPHGRDEGFAENKEIVERDPCPKCGGQVTYTSFHRAKERQPYAPIVTRYEYRAFGVCRACDMAFEF